MVFLKKDLDNLDTLEFKPYDVIEDADAERYLNGDLSVARLNALIRRLLGGCVRGFLAEAQSVKDRQAGGEVFPELDSFEVFRGRERVARTFDLRADAELFGAWDVCFQLMHCFAERFRAGASDEVAVVYSRSLDAFFDSAIEESRNKTDVYGRLGSLYRFVKITEQYPSELLLSSLFSQYLEVLEGGVDQRRFGSELDLSEQLPTHLDTSLGQREAFVHQALVYHPELLRMHMYMRVVNVVKSLKLSTQYKLLKNAVYCKDALVRDLTKLSKHKLQNKNYVEDLVYLAEFLCEYYESQKPGLGERVRRVIGGQKRVPSKAEDILPLRRLAQKQELFEDPKINNDGPIESYAPEMNLFDKIYDRVELLCLKGECRTAGWELRLHAAADTCRSLLARYVQNPEELCEDFNYTYRFPSLKLSGLKRPNARINILVRSIDMMLAVVNKLLAKLVSEVPLPNFEGGLSFADAHGGLSVADQDD